MRWIAFLSGLLLLLFTGLSFADKPVIEQEVMIDNGGSPLQIGEQTDPFVVDWNNDGKKDLLLGYYGPDILLFLNQGTNEAPVFNGYTALQSGGTSMYVSFG